MKTTRDTRFFDRETIEAHGQAAHSFNNHRVSELLDDIDELRYQLQRAVHKMNWVSAPWRHKNPELALDNMDELYERQLELEKFLENLG